jgi:superfamily II DNA helicase RecQ
VKKSTLERLIDKLVEAELLAFFMDREYRLLRITDRGRQAGLEDLDDFASKRSPAASRREARTVDSDGDDPASEELFNRLREWRRDRAIQDAVPPYVIAHDAQLRSLADYRPLDSMALLEVPGFGPTRVERYGEEIVAVIAGFADSDGPGG